MDPGCALPGEIERRVDGVAVESLGAGLALSQADGLTPGDIDGGKEDELGCCGEVVHGSSCVGGCAGFTPISGAALGGPKAG